MPVIVFMECLGESVAVPVLDRLAATGRTGRLQVSGDSRFALFGRLASGPEQTPPLGYAVALGLEGVERPDPARIWCCLGFTHLYRKQNDLLFLAAERTGQTPAECWTLVDALLPDLQADGWELHPASRQDRRTLAVLSRAPGLDAPVALDARPLEQLEGCSLRDCSPSGPYARRLLPLLTAGQLLLARHPINLERQRAGRLPLNTPWIWGVGSGIPYTPMVHAGGGRCWTADPVLAGLARASGCAVERLDEQGDFSPLVEAVVTAVARGTVWIHLTAPAILARHGLPEARQTFLHRLNGQLLDPLSQRLADTRETLMMVASDGVAEAEGENTLTWVRASGRALTRRRRFWQRSRPGQGGVWGPAEFWSVCAS